jgi:hypothetical protein
MKSIRFTPLQMGMFALTALAGIAAAFGLIDFHTLVPGMLLANAPFAVTQETLDLAKGALAKSDDNITKTVNTGTGLVAFDLQAPAKNLYPVNTPLRNRVPRVGGGTGLATNWRAVKAILGSGFDAMGWVPEGQRTARMSYTTATVAASYVTIGEEDQVTYEAISAARTFEDIRSTASMRVLQKMMLKEENAILMGNASVNLGTPVTPTVSAAGSGATLPAATYSVIVVALTGEGFRGASVAAGVPTVQTFTGADGQTYTLNGGSSNKSSAASQAVTLGQTLSCSTTTINGAMGYAWFTGVSGSERLEKITTINSATFSAPLLGTGQLASAITAVDKSSNPSLAFDGLLYSAFKPGSGAYMNTLATGTPGVGTVLTASSRGTVNEIDQMLRTMWDQYQVSPTVIYVNAQELNNITTKTLQGPSSSPLLQIFTDPKSGYQGMMAGGVVGFYFNPFAMDGGIKIPIMIHPALPAGTIIGWCEDLPSMYKSNNVPNVAEMKTRQDYYQIDWPLRTRAQEFGVYAEEVLAVYAPFAMGVINNIANG